MTCDPKPGVHVLIYIFTFNYDISVFEFQRLVYYY